MNKKNISYHCLPIIQMFSKSCHCVKSVQIRSYFWSEKRKIRTRNNSVFRQFSRGAIKHWILLFDIFANKIKYLLHLTKTFEALYIKAFCKVFLLLQNS